MNVLLTGGSGFVGINIAEALLAAGCRVMLFGPAPLPKRAEVAFTSFGDRVTLVRGDVRDERALRDCITSRAIDAIIHGAALTPGEAGETREAMATVDVNVLGTTTLVTAVATCGITRLLLLSSASVYGSQDDDRELDERTTRPNPASLYAITKFAAEQVAGRLAARHRLDLRVARLGSVFGPWERDGGVRDTVSAIFQVMQAAAAGRDVVLPRPGRRDWIYAPEAAAAVAALLLRDAPCEGAINIGLGAEWSVADWCERLARTRPEFRWRIARPGEPATIDFHGPHDRPALATRRLASEIGFTPRFGLDAACDHYSRWLSEDETP